MTARFGSFAIFLLLNDSSHDPHFSACQNIETLDGIQKISNFSFHRFSRYLTPNMALQKIILTSFFFMLNNYVVQHIGSASMTARFGSFAIFLLLNDSSHDPYFSSKYSRPEKKFQIFLSTGFPDNWLQTRLSRRLFWLLFLFLFFFVFLLPDRGLCVLRAITSRRYWAIGTKFRRHGRRWM